MANVVVAVGAVLTVLGSWAVYFGYTIVQVERGWATMIAGSVVLSGGVITAVLGLVLRRLMAMQRALQPRLTTRPKAMRVETKEPSPQLEFALVPPALPHIDRMNEPVLAPPEPQRVDLPPETHKQPHDEAHSAPAVAADAAPDPEHDGVDDAWRAVHAELQRTDWTAPVHTPDAPAAPSLAADLPAHEAVHAAAEHHPPEAGEMHVAPPLAAEPASSVEVAPLPPLAHEHPSEPASAETVEFEDDYRDLLGPTKVEPASASHAGVAEPAAEVPAAAHEAPSPASSTRHVIGTYDADGTTYTMYSDGSIEAHSPDGVYQFGSMAELKAFIEQAP